MILNQYKVDDSDRVMLIAAMLAANENENVPEDEIYRVSVSEVGLFFKAAQQALAQIVADHVETPTEWDGVVWHELFEASDDGSLADLLVGAIADKGEQKLTPEEIRHIVVAWLKACDR